jgi:mannose-6-phosphate isomerase-like protein (cupin superfamily)
MATHTKVNLADALAQVHELWSPQVIGQVNDQYVKVARVHGDLAWHSHDHEDELFLVLKGALTIEYEDGAVQLEAGDLHIVPKGKRHNPVAAEPCEILLVETVTTEHTGTEVTAKTRSIADQLSGVLRS